MRRSLLALPVVVILLLVASLVIMVRAQESVSPTDAMLAANQSYEAGHFEQAVARYDAIIQAGLYNSDVYYNLGNAYFKQGDLGRAILNYRRAHFLSPRDPDVAANLSVARTQTVDQIEAPAGEGLTNLIQFAEDWLTLREAAILALFLWLLINFLVLVAILVPRLRRLAWIAMAVLGAFLLAGLISMGNRFYMEQRYPPAVVVAQEINVTSGPGSADQYLLEFTLHAGAEVRLLDNRPGWRRISLPGDLQGWVPEDAVEPVINW